MKYIYVSFIIISLLSSCQKSLKDIIQDTENATFIIYTYDEYGIPRGSGSGFFIDEYGTGITNYHVLDGAAKAILKTTDNKEYEIDKVIASDKDWDIIKFTTINKENTKFRFLKFVNKNVEKGDIVYNISSPLGLEKSISNGIISSVREDKQHGEIIQITAPISPGSSGSALLNEQGKVFGVATFNKTGGQNLNFGVAINQEKIAILEKNDFIRFNTKFNQKENFIILNVKSDNSQDITLHAIEFKPEVTIAYFSYTNLNLAYGNNMLIWCEINKEDEGFTIHDLEHNKKYFITSSTIGIDKDHGTEVALATSYKFKVFFPPIKEKLKDIDITYGYTSRGWQFRNLDLDKYRNNITINLDNYEKEFAYSTMYEGNLKEAVSVFSSILERTPDDLDALNAMGIISYAIDNNNDAEYYFSEAIKFHPNNSLSYTNRAQIYKYQKNYQSALQDLSQALNLDSAQPDNYVNRAQLLMDMEKWEDAENDWTKAIESPDFKRDEIAYMLRAICKIKLGKKQEACKDIEIAYNLTTDVELEQELQNMWKQCGC